MTVFQKFLQMVDRYPDRPFLRAPFSSTRNYAPTAIEYSYAQTRDAALGLSNALVAAGVAEGDRVAVAYDSRLDVYLHLLALNALGASLVPLNMAGSDSELLYVIDHSDCKLITGIDEYLERLASIAAHIETVAVFAVSDIESTGEFSDAYGTDSTEAALLYTSGTTGKPKGCMLSNQYFLTMGTEYNKLGGLCAIDESDRLATPLPPGHMNALATSFMAMMLCGGCIIQLDRFHPRSWWQTAREEGATIIHYLGVMPAILLTLDANDDDFSAQIKFGFGAGSDPKHQQIFEERFGFPLIEAWAMTESGGGGMIVANQEPRHLGQRCIGKPIDSMEVRIADANGDPVICGEDGELLVRSRAADSRAGYFTAYYKDAKATDAGWLGGWWHTGDIIREGEDGSLYFVDRLKNVIRRSGENIAAIEVETALLQSTMVENCAVTAVPDEMRGDEVFAMVVARPPATDEVEMAQQLFEEAMGLLIYFKVPGYVCFVSELPLTGSQKVNRAAVKAGAKSRVVDGDCIDLRDAKRRRSS